MDGLYSAIDEAPAGAWLDVCDVEEIVAGTGVCALLAGQQIAVVRAGGEVFAISNFDPFSKAFVLSRGIVGDKGGTLKIASPIYKQCFDLRTGACMDDPQVQLPVYACRVRAGRVEVWVEARGGRARSAAQAA